MSDFSIRRYLPPAVMLAGFFMVWSSRSQSAVALVGSLKSILPSYSNLRVVDSKVSDEERRVAGMSDYVARQYWRSDSTVAFTAYIGYYDRQSQGKTMHSPKNCLPGAGWEVLRADTGSFIANGQKYVVNKNMLKNGPNQALVMYWYQGRGRVVASEYAVKFNLLRDAALKGHTEEALVRIMVPIRKAGTLNPAELKQATAEAEQLGNDVATRLVGEVSSVLPNMKAT